MIFLLLLLTVTTVNADTCIEKNCWDGVVDRNVLISEPNRVKVTSVTPTRMPKNLVSRPILSPKTDEPGVSLTSQWCDGDKCDEKKVIND